MPKCQLCGKEIVYGGLTDHLEHSHGMTPSQYHHKIRVSTTKVGKSYCSICCKYIEDITLKDHVTYKHKISMPTYYGRVIKDKNKPPVVELKGLRFNNQVDKDFRIQSIKNKLVKADEDYKNATGSAKRVWWQAVKELRDQLREAEAAAIERRR